MCNLSRAFDTQKHEILIEKLLYYGKQGRQIYIFKCYLKNRTVRVKWQNATSDFVEIDYRVPQGSVLDPVIFIIDMNDMWSKYKSDLLTAQRLLENAN